MAFKDNAVELEERVVAINRVTKVVKGGRNMRYNYSSRSSFRIWWSESIVETSC